MKSLLLCALFLAPNFRVEPIQLTGEYSLNSIQVVKSWRQETLDTRTAPGQARAEELRAAGWECVRKSIFDVCRGDDAIPLTEAELADYHEQAEAKGPLVFGTALGNPSVWVEGEFYVEFMHEQPVTWNGTSRPQFRIFQSDDVTKLNVLDGAGNLEDALVISGEDLIHSSRVHRARGAMTIDVYYLDEIYRQ